MRTIVLPRVANNKPKSGMMLFILLMYLALCRIMLKSYDVNNTTLLGSVINSLPDSNVEVRLDGMEDALIVGLECIRPVDARSAVVLAESFFESGFKASSINFVQNLCTDY